MNTEKGELENLGWDEFFESKKTELESGEFSVARVTAEHRGGYKVRNEKGEYLAKIRGKQMYESRSREDYPAVGDWVVIKVLDNDQSVVQAVLPRKSVIRRRFGDRDRAGEKSDVQIIATNIDVAFIVQSVGRDFSVNRYERYLAIAKDEGIKPVVILNKIDLVSEEELNIKLSEIRNRLGGIDIIPTSIKNDEGISQLKNFIEKGKTYCFLGSSGVGKSSLINKLLGKDNIKTGDISSYSDRGKHVTTAREMYFLASGGIVIDNPGIREVGMTDIKEGIDSLFDEMMTFAKKCKFADCTHTHEPGCAILAAIDDGKIDKDRYANFISLKRESDFYQMSKFERREKDRDFGKFINNVKKDLKKLKNKY